MSTSPHTDAASRSVARPAAIADWAELFKLRITAFVAFAAVTGALLAAPHADLALVLEAALLIAANAAAASAFNQVLERDTDRLMVRTRNRPLVAGRISVRDAVLAAGTLATLGTAGLALRFEPLAGLLALATLVVYVLVYTPLKRLTSFNTVIGALPGAMPPLLGAVALAGEPGIWGWALFANLFVWQFPHFMAIAWIYRDDYARAGLAMLPSVPGGRALAGRQAFLHGLAILPTGLLPLLESQATWFYAFGALAAGVAYLAAAWRFLVREDERSARGLLFTSLLYLPVLYAIALADRLLLQL